MIRERKITADGVQLNVAESGHGKNALIFIHGNSMSLDCWAPQLTDKALLEKYRLIAFDLPGHGKSGRTDDYSFRRMNAILTQLIQLLDADSFILIGLSVGSNYIAEIAPNLSGCQGYICASPCITNNEQHPGTFFRELPGAELFFSETAPPEQLGQLIDKVIFNGNEILRESVAEDFNTADPNFRTQLGMEVIGGKWADEIANLISTELPILIIMGKEDPVIRTDYLDGFPSKWNDRAFLVENAAHLVNREQPEAFNALLSAYAGEQFAK